MKTVFKEFLNQILLAVVIVLLSIVANNYLSSTTLNSYQNGMTQATESIRRDVLGKLTANGEVTIPITESESVTLVKKEGEK